MEEQPQTANKKSSLPFGAKNHTDTDLAGVNVGKTRMNVLKEVRVSVDTLFDPNLKSINSISPDSESYQQLKQVIEKKPAI